MVFASMKRSSDDKLDPMIKSIHCRYSYVSIPLVSRSLFIISRASHHFVLSCDTLHSRSETTYIRYNVVIS